MNVNLSRVLSFIAGAVIGALGAMWYFAPQTFTPAPQPSQTATSTPAPPSQGSGDVSVSNQAAGDSVEIDSVTVAPPGVWVAVEDVNRDGSLGSVLGAARVGGPRSNISVPLLRSTLPGTTYAVILYRDDGSGQFAPTDSVYVDFDTGQPVEALFHTN